MRAAAAARVLIADLIYAQNLAISNGAKVYVKFDVASSKYTLLTTASSGGDVAANNPITQTTYVQQFGSASRDWQTVTIDSADFDAEAAALEASRAAKRESSAISSRDIPLHSAYYRYLRAPTFSDASTEAMAELRRQLDAREQAEQRFQKLSVLLSTSGTTGKLLASPSDLLTRAPSAAMVHAGGDCVKAMLQSLRRFGCAYDDYSLQFHRLLVNYCALHPQPQQLLAATSFGTKQIEQVCTPTMGEQKAKATTILME